MTTRLLISLVLIAIAIMSAQPGRSEVVHGSQGIESTYDAVFGHIGTDGFDFDTQTIVLYTSDAADLYYGEWAEGNGFWLECKNCFGTIVEMPLDALEVAPELTGGLGIQGVVVAPNRTFVVRTADGIYAKFVVRQLYDGINGNGGCCSMVIEYDVQTDGSPSFTPELPVRSSTWGAVKALYR